MPPSPSWPDLSSPQAYRDPDDVRASAWAKPVVTSTTPLPEPRPVTGWGVEDRWPVPELPSPSCPEAPLPHASTVPSDVRARANASPAEMATTPLPEPRPVTGWGVEDR